jgi:hypothetical protein
MANATLDGGSEGRNDKGPPRRQTTLPASGTSEANASAKPHRDRKGRVIQVGDVVYIPCVVVKLYDEGDVVNVKLETVERTRETLDTTKLALNSRQVDKRTPREMQAGGGSGGTGDGLQN